MLVTGTQTFEVPKDSQVDIEATGHFSLVEIDESGKPVHVVGNSEANKFRHHCRKDCKMKVQAPKTTLLKVEARPIPPVTEPYDPVPVEALIEEPLSLQDSIKAFCAQLVSERYGRDSEEVDAFEEAFDFDIEDGDDDVLLSGHEVVDIPQDGEMRDVSEEPDAGPASADDTTSDSGDSSVSESES